jgi:hypothetical protein
MNVTSLQFWRKFQDLGEKLRSDPALLEALREDPLRVISEAGLDMRIESDDPAESGKTLLELVAQMEEPQRQATLQSLIPPQIRASDDEEAVIFGLANANVFLNVNIYMNANININANVNANANANANANTNGIYDAHSADNTTVLELSPGYRDSAFAHVMRSLHLSESRQKALLKRALLDAEDHQDTEIGGQQKRRVARYTYKQLDFEVEGLLAGPQITEVQVRFLD